MNDSLCLCTFTSSGVWGASTDKIVVDMLNPLCGWNWKTDEYWMAAKRIITAERVFNVREGISAKDDRLPKRMYAEKLPAGPKKGVVFTARTTRKHQTDAYKFFGWDEKGIPTEATLKVGGLEFLIDDLNAARKKFNLNNAISKRGRVIRSPALLLHFSLLITDSNLPRFACSTDIAALQLRT